MNNRNTLHKPLRALRASRLLLLLTLAPAATTGLKAQSYYDEATQLYMDSLLNHMQGSAFTHLLQKPPVAKHFKQKKFGDHMFIEGGVGLNTTLTHTSDFLYLERPGLEASVAIGDWITPVHGWRAGLRGGTYALEQTLTKAVSLSGDWLLNITALASPTYDAPKKSELYGVAGLELASVYNNRTTRYALGMRLGLHGQTHITDNTYLFAEPQLLIADDNLYHADNWRKTRFTARLTAGVGYRLRSDLHPADSTMTSDGHFLSNTFIQVAAGPTAVANSDPSTWNDRMGTRAQVSVGKWFAPHSALRLTGIFAGYRQKPAGRAKTVTVQAGYLLNLHNLLGGYDPQRNFWLNAVADASANYTSGSRGKKVTAGLGAGLQTHFRLADGVSFFLEPRVDYMQDDFAQDITSTGNWDVAASLLAGVTLAQGPDTRRQQQRNADFKQQGPAANIFFETSMGAATAVGRQQHGSLNIHPLFKMFAAVGKWYTATSGARLWAEGTQYKVKGTGSYKSVALGVDYLWNVTNALHGYLPSRRCELITAVGGNVAVRRETKRLYPGANLALRGVWNVNPMWGLYLEPQTRIYGNNFLPGNFFPDIKMDVTAAVMAGVQVSLRHYDAKRANARFEDDGRQAFFSLAGGTGTYANSLRHWNGWGTLGRVSYGCTYSPLSAWRLNLQGFERLTKDGRYARGTVGADYLLDFSAMGMDYNPDRSVTLRGVVGADLGCDFVRHGKLHALAEAHGGFQLGVKATPELEVYAEPQVGYLVGGSAPSSRSARFQPRVLLGVNCHLTTTPRAEQTGGAADRKQFVSLSLGTGSHTATVTAMHPFRRKYIFNLDASYGQWLTAVSGWSAGVTYTVLQQYAPGNRKITALHANYLLNVLTLTGGARQLESPWLLTAYAGASFNISSRERYGTDYAPGLRFGMQMGYRIDKQWAVYLEPGATVTSKNIIPHSSHPAEGQITLSAGVKYSF